MPPRSWNIVLLTIWGLYAAEAMAVLLLGVLTNSSSRPSATMHRVLPTETDLVLCPDSLDGEGIHCWLSAWAPGLWPRAARVVNYEEEFFRTFISDPGR